MSNIKQETIEIAVAAFLHDIGKFYQKVAEDSGNKLLDDSEYRIKFCPTKYGYQTHIHSAYTALFIKECLKNIPEITDIDNFVDLAAKHHLNVLSDECAYIQSADWLSAGIDREKVEEADKINYLDYTKTRLMSIFDELDRNITSYEARNYQYSLGKFNANNIFPEEKDNNNADYTTIVKGFNSELGAIKTDNLKDWFLKFDEVYQKWLSFVPSVSAGDTLPDISLYDHLKTTSAFAQALYKYHKETEGKISKKDIKDREIEKFLYFKAKFNGIQNFIFSEGSETNKNAAKILRGRSFYISLIMKRTADLLCESLSLAHSAIIMSAAGSITAILPNTENTKNILRDVEEAINKWLFEKFYGEVSISFGYIEASGKDFCTKDDENTGTKTIGSRLAEEMEKKKFQKLSLDNLGVIKNYFENGETPCPYCGKRPKSAEDDSCPICKDLIEIGKHLCTRKLACNLNEPIFGIYNKIKVSDYDNLYVPLKEDKEGKTTVKDFGTLVQNGSDKGIEALGILKADIDNLGSLFSKISNRGGLSRQVTLSRMLDAFWTLWLPNELKEKYPNIYTVFSGGDDLFLIGKWDTIIDFALHLRDKFKEYTCANPAITFSAGIAILKNNMPISKFYELSEEALEKSKNYEVGNRKKNALTLFGETISWGNKKDLENSYSDINELIAGGKINSAALNKIMRFIDMASKAEDITEKSKREKIPAFELENLKWMAMLTYFIARNEKFKNQEDKQNRINNFIKDIKDKNSRSILKTMIWRNIYENRTRRN